MATIALVDASPATAALVEAAAAGHSIIRCGAVEIPQAADLIIADVARAELARTFAEELAAHTAPVLMLIARSARIDRASLSSGGLSFLQNPCDLVTLQRKIRELLEAVPATAVAERQWLETPRVAEAAAALLAAATRLRGPVLIAGETGTGTEEAAAALALAWNGKRTPVIWAAGEPISSILERLDDERRVLWVPAIDERPRGDRQALQSLLALEPARRIVVTSSDSLDEHVAEGTFPSGLFAALSRMAIRLAPLRERTSEITPLSSTIAQPLARALGSGRCDFTDEALRLLETYPWPGNVVELEAVVTRSVVGRIVASRYQVPTVEIDRQHLLFAPTLAPPGSAVAQDNAGVTSHRAAVVVPLVSVAPTRAAKTSDATSSETAQATETASQARRQQPSIEAVLAAFAHDIRNPMATIKTFAGLEAGGGGELAQLAATACESIDGHLDLLQRYAQLGTGTNAEQAIDLVDILGEAVETAGAESSLELAARGSLRFRCDIAFARFIADAIVAECQARASEAGLPATADLAAGRTAIAIHIPLGGSAVSSIGKWLGDGEVPWRLSIARDAAQRVDCDLEVQAADGELRIEWRTSSSAEVAEPTRLHRSPSSPSSSRASAAASRPKAKQQ